MGIVFYASEINGTGKLLRDLYQDLLPHYEAEFCQTVECLAHKLCRYHDDPKIAVLLACTQKELSDFLLFQDMLSSFRLILILPDNDKSTIKKGYSLYPRYLTYKGNNFNWMAAVLRKMLSTVKNNSINGFNRKFVF